MVLLFKCGSARFNPLSKTIGTLTVSEGQTTIQTRVNPMSCFTCLSYLIHWTIFHPSGCTSVTTSLKITLLTKTSPMNTRSIFNMHLMHWDIHHQKTGKRHYSCTIICIAMYLGDFLHFSFKLMCMVGC